MLRADGQMSSAPVLSSNAVQDSFREVAMAATRKAGALLHDQFGASRRVSFKSGPTNLVTEMDLRAEALIVETIRSRFPDHAILAEERGALPGSVRYPLRGGTVTVSKAVHRPPNRGNFSPRVGHGRPAIRLTASPPCSHPRRPPR